MRSREFYAILGGAIAVVTIVYLPLRIIELVSAGKLDVLFGGIVIFLLLVTGSAIAFFSIIIPVLEGEPEGEDRAELERRLNMYRARQRAMLEELDEVKRVLEEIRDILREGLGE